MHSPRVVAADDARAALQRLNDYYLKTMCRLIASTPRKLLLTELGLLPVQVFWSQTLPIWNSLAGLLVGSFTTLSVWTTLPMPFRKVLAVILWLTHR